MVLEWDSNTSMSSVHHDVPLKARNVPSAARVRGCDMRMQQLKLRCAIAAWRFGAHLVTGQAKLNVGVHVLGLVVQYQLNQASTFEA